MRLCTLQKSNEIFYNFHHFAQEVCHPKMNLLLYYFVLLIIKHQFLIVENNKKTQYEAMD